MNGSCCALPYVDDRRDSFAGDEEDDSTAFYEIVGDTPVATAVCSCRLEKQTYRMLTHMRQTAPRQKSDSKSETCNGKGEAADHDVRMAQDDDAGSEAQVCEWCYSRA